MLGSQLLGVFEHYTAHTLWVVCQGSDSRASGTILVLINQTSPCTGNHDMRIENRFLLKYSSEVLEPKRIFITSDWHLGGSSDDEAARKWGTRICRSAEAIAGFIEWIHDEKQESDQDCELIINGDMVDFLAPDKSWDPSEWANEDMAVKRLDQIAQECDQAGHSPFRSIANLLENGGAVTLLLGNHDVELSLPKVRRRLQSLLGAEKGRFQFIYDGEACVRGRLLIEHGNRYDAFNSLDYSTLRQERSHISRGLPIDEKLRKERFFLPPAGTILVIHVINELLRTHPYLNLLKPETKAAIPLLIALRPEIEPVLNFIVKVWEIRRRKNQGRIAGAVNPRDPGRQAGQSGSHDTTKYKSLEEVLKETLSEEEFARVVQPMRPIAGEQAGSVSAQAGLLERVGAMFRALKASSREALQLFELLFEANDARRRTLIMAAFRKLALDTSFAVDHEVAEYFDAARELLHTGQFSHIVFGHTHLPKQIKIERGSTLPAGFYLNCGTWADVMAVPTQIDGAEADAALKAFVEDLATRNLKPHLRRYLSYVEAALYSDGTVEAQLRSYCGKGREREAPLTDFVL
jgi:UDP-2,3-diacylglucosamine pyrophosphatase LpxH